MWMPSDGLRNSLRSGQDKGQKKNMIIIKPAVKAGFSEV